MNKYLIFIAVFLTGLSLFIYEVLLTRLFSAVLTYNLAFVVVSLAILGSGLGGILTHKITGNKKITSEKLLLTSSQWLPVSIIVSIALMYFLPFSLMFIMYVFTGMMPFILGGMVISTIFKSNIGVSGKLYFMDLLGSGIGSIAVIGIMNKFGFMSSVIVVTIFALLAFFSVSCYYRKTLKIAAAGVFLILLTGSLIQGSVIKSLEKRFYAYYTSPGTVINMLRDSDEKPLGISFSKWNAISRTDVIETTNKNEKLIVTDGGATAPIIKFNGNLNEVQYLKESVNYIPFSFGKNDDTLVIGSGGGKDVLFALLGGSRKIDAVEINPSTIEAVNNFKDFSGDIYNRPEVKVYNQDGRNFIENSSDKYDNIYLSMVMTNAIENTMYSLSENYIYTYEAFKTYLKHLKDNGKLSFMVHNAYDLAKITNTGIKVLLDKGISQDKVTDYFVIVNGVNRQESGEHGGGVNMPLVIFKNTPFTWEEINSIKNITEMQNRDIIHLPGKEDPVYKALKNKEITYTQLIKEIPFNSKPTTDNSPFFFNYSKLLPFEMYFVLLIVLFVWIVVRRKYIEQKEHRGISFYFAGLGLAYMLVEIPIIQKMVLYFGSPSLAFSFILFSLLAGSGIGSALSSHEAIEKHLLKPPKYLLITGIVIIVSQWSIIWMLNEARGLQLIYRFIVVFIAMMPMGIAMGIPFPTGIKRLESIIRDKNLVPLMWGVNGIFSVLGSTLAIIISMIFGFNAALNIGAIIYIYLFISNPLRMGKAPIQE
ncbi:hypothetical protein [Fonticella tunisiensis]|uniref:Putative membrane-bound spermidine synthase n=1 Tax=Fonticella tunisiensis TaxID=1096341 RepID=A0A4R7KU91_9CLOT|nr:hypothetical protein [Fonticella tunisiensis]TDT63633.1 putative membrane-bound spermidine synthase [Fonticella tunisiensis]